ncbi:glucose-6-phosphate isomerase [Rhizina undulata]
MNLRFRCYRSTIPLSDITILRVSSHPFGELLHVLKDFVDTFEDKFSVDFKIPAREVAERYVEDSPVLGEIAFPPANIWSRNLSAPAFFASLTRRVKVSSEKMFLEKFKRISIPSDDSKCWEQAIHDFKNHLPLQTEFTSPTLKSFSEDSVLPTWQAIQEYHRASSRNYVFKDLFDKEAECYQKYSLYFESYDGIKIVFDFSKNIVSDETITLLVKLAKEAIADELRDKMFARENNNFMENIAVLHAALDNVSCRNFKFDGRSVLKYTKESSERVRREDGPVVVSETLKAYGDITVSVTLCLTLTALTSQRLCAKSDTKTTLFLIASVTFTTAKTYANANTAKSRFLSQPASINGDISDIAKPFIALSANTEEVERFGIDSNNVFGCESWDEARYSIWSTVVFSIPGCFLHRHGYLITN